VKFFSLALWVACLSSAAFSLDREAFSFTKYDLQVQIEPEQHRIGVRGKIMLRNDSPTPQKVAVLQISSSLDWRSIKAADKAVQFVTQPYTSDIDHTGALSEAIVTLPQAIAPKETVELEVGYEGVILPDATRLTRIGTPEDAAKSTDWDQIDTNFTAVRGAGYVAWYPIATEVVNLSEGNEVADAVRRWKNREAGSKMHVHITLITESSEYPSAPQILLGGTSCSIVALDAMAFTRHVTADCAVESLRWDAPTLIVADYQALEKPSIEVLYLPKHDAAAIRFAEAAEQTSPLVTEWFGKQRERAKAADLPDADAAPFESGPLLLIPLANGDSKLAGLAAAHQLTHASFLSLRPWIEEGLAHFAQALYLEREKGRQAALDYMGLHRSAFREAEKFPAPGDDTRALVNTTSDEMYRSKAMCVWWMLRDIVGESALKKAIANYRPEKDNDVTYMPRLIAAQTQHELDWFFDDWLYHDRGLPDFKIESVFPRKTATETFMVTITVDNLGTAGAEVPLTLKFAGGDVTKRLEVRAKSKGVIRVEIPKEPQEVVVNDSSVPESASANNVFKVTAPPQ
jgi:hypothetical protein